MRIHLEFDNRQTPIHRKRIDYAFRCFCAIYRHTPIPKAECGSADVCISYSKTPNIPKHVLVLQIPNLYVPRPADVPSPKPTSMGVNGSALTLIHGSAHGNADWLAEIFEWLSCADEYSVDERDSVGRIPFRSTLLGRNSLDPVVPRAGIAMQHLQKCLAQVVGQSEDVGFRPIGKLCVINTHDVDFLSNSRPATSFRLAKNCVISCLEGWPSLGCMQAIDAVRTISGGAIPIVSPQSLADSEIRRGVTASYYFLVFHSHRRDGNYQLADPEVSIALKYLQNAGMEVGIHNSYTCLDEPDGLVAQYRILSQMGVHAIGGRQHWLRFSMDRLIEAVERAQARYDASLGWTDQIGFRAGACFAFPPYDFRNERPANFLELPLAITDSALAAIGDFATAREVSNRILESSRYCLGGFSILWHPASFKGAQLPAWVGEAFWTIMDMSTQYGDAWLSAEHFLEQAYEQYSMAGLLSGNTAHAQQHVEL